MKCIICKSEMSYYFNKVFHEYDLNTVDYYRCSHCGFVASKQHREMGIDAWERLNIAAHSKYNDEKYKDDSNNPPPYFQQAIMLYLLSRNDILSRGKWLDWGSGLGKLSSILKGYFDIPVDAYDKYITSDAGAIGKSELEKKYKLVIASAVFEHITNEGVIEEIDSYVSADGALAIHTLIREEIPNDPEWFYLLPVHCAFHTNKSMSIFMDEYGYRCSVYSPQAKTWVLFKKTPDDIKKRVNQINTALGMNYLFYKYGFMDYWK